MKIVLLVVIVALVLITSPISPGDRSPPPSLPDWVELEGVRLPAQIRDEFQELSLPVFSNLEDKPRLLVYPYPQVQRLTLDPGGVWDVAFFDIGGRAIDVYPAASCLAPCAPLESRFPAASVLIAPVGTFSLSGMKRHGAMRWGERPPSVVRTFPIR